jgi:hypothetical protein
VSTFHVSSIKTQKRNYIDNLTKIVEETAAKGNMRELYDSTQKLEGKYQQTNKPVKVKDGTAISSMKEQANRWR